MTDFNTRIIREFRANAGTVGGDFEGSPLILIHHKGAKSAAEHVAPLGCFPQSDGRYVIVASNGGGPKNPDWYYNLSAHPEIDVEFGSERFGVTVKELEDRERDEVWENAINAAPQLAEYKERTSRKIPVLRLTRNFSLRTDAGRHGDGNSAIIQASLRTRQHRSTEL